jgi:hypothetical protein
MNIAPLDSLIDFGNLFSKKNTKQNNENDRLYTNVKIERATKLVQTGAKVGVNYLKYYGEKSFRPDT